YSFLFLRKDALDQVLEPRIPPEGVEPSVDLDTAEDPGSEGRAIFVALFQEPQRFLLVAQRQVDNSERIGRDIALSEFTCKVVEYLAGPFFPPRQCVGPSERGQNSRVGIELYGFLILNDCFRQLAFVLLGLAETPGREIER